MFRALALIAVLACAESPLFAQSQREEPGSLAAALRPFVDQKVLAGAVLVVVDKDRVLAEETVGFSDIAGDKPMAADSLFWIASMSKPITGTVLMLLVDEGKVAIDDPVEKYLPEFGKMWVASEKSNERMVLTRPATKVTIRHILSHTAGQFCSAPRLLWRLGAFVPEFFDLSFEFFQRGPAAQVVADHFIRPFVRLHSHPQAYE
jgi:CubicO group peptidase (beta-lactamase class C family)